MDKKKELRTMLLEGYGEIPLPAAVIISFNNPNKPNYQGEGIANDDVQFIVESTDDLWIQWERYCEKHGISIDAGTHIEPGEPVNLKKIEVTVETVHRQSIEVAVTPEEYEALTKNACLSEHIESVIEDLYSSAEEDCYVDRDYAIDDENGCTIIGWNE